MEKRDTIILLLLAGAGAYAAHANWDTLRVKLGFDDFRPGRIKAMELAKEAFTFDPPTPNSIVVRQREKNGEITLKGEPWQATEIAAPKWRVTCTFTENGESRVHVFLVDIGTNSVAYQGLDESKPAPR